MDLFPIFYAGNIAYYRSLLSAQEVVFERYEHFPKQTYRNRLEILSPNGIHRLSIPIRKQGKKPMHEVEINYAENWRKDHWKGLEAAYRRSPYFEYYEDRFKPFYTNEWKYLIEFNLEMHQLILDLLSAKTPHTFTSEYFALHKSGRDFRTADFSTKSAALAQDSNTYLQVFGDRFPFEKNLSVLDALFNLGPSSKTILI